MGNQLSQPQKLQPEHLAELNDMTLKDMLGGSRLLKTALCLHDDGGLVVVKVYYKRKEVPNLQPYRTGLEDIRARLQGFPAGHVWPFQHWVETDRAVYLIRQHLYASLAHRLASRPFLSFTEKLWVAYQVLEGLASAHAASVHHGDLKTENVLLTSWHWVYLADWASYKPVCLPADNPADFSFYFDTGSRRCYIAPERFYDAPGQVPAQTAGGVGGAPRGSVNSRPRCLTPEMDIFSAGCVLAEMFMEGAPLFDLSQLLAYRKGKADPAPQLAELPDPLRSLLLHMIQLTPGARLGAAQYLQQWTPRLFPTSFATLLHPFLGSLAPLSPDDRVVVFDAEFDALQQGLMADDSLIDIEDDEGSSDDTSSDNTRCDAPPHISVADHHVISTAGAAELLPLEKGRRRGEGEVPFRSNLLAGVEALLSDTTHLLHRLSTSGAASAGFDNSSNGEGAFFGRGERRDGSALSFDETYITRLPTPNGDSSSRVSEEQPPRGAASRGSRDVNSYPLQSSQLASGIVDFAAQAVERPVAGMDLLAAALCPLVRGARLQHRKVRAMALLARAAQGCDDGTRLRRIVPYLVAGTGELQAPVRVAALTALVDVVASVVSLPPSDVKIITEYILPSLSLLPRDGPRAVRVCFATVLPSLAAAALRLVGGGRASSVTHATVKLPKVDWEGEVAAVRAAVERPVKELMSSHPHSSSTHRALLAGLPNLAAFFGREYCNETLLLLAISFLNDSDWQLRAAFYVALPCLAVGIGPKEFDLFLRPCLDKGLADREGAVVVAAVDFLKAAATSSLLDHRALIASMAAVAPLLLSPSTSVRAAATSVVALAAGQLSAADVYAQLRPLLLPPLRNPLITLSNELDVAANLKPSESPQAALSVPAGSPYVSVGTSHLTQQSGRGSLTARSSGGSSAATSRIATATYQITEASPARSGILAPTRPKVLPSSRASVVSADTSVTSAYPAEELDSRHARPPLASIPLYTMRVDAAHVEADSSILSAALMSASPAGTRGNTGQRHHPSSSDSGFPVMHQSIGGPWQQAGAQQNQQLAGSNSATELMKLARRTGPKPAHQVFPGRLSLNSEEPLSLPRPPSLSLQGSEEMMNAVDAGSDAEARGGRLIGGHGITIPSGAAGPEPWRPKGVLVAHLAEHKAAVNQVAIAGGGAFFVTASSDTVVKVWDCRGLERDASFRSRLTYSNQGGRILSVCNAEGEASIASASDDGSLHLWRIDYTSRQSHGGSGRAGPHKYTGVSALAVMEAGEGAVTDVRPWGRNMLLYTTQHGGLHGWDTRMKGDAWRLETAPREGVVTHLAADSAAVSADTTTGGPPPWLLTASLRGWCNVWDMRFRLPVSAWQHPAQAIDAVEAAAAPASHLGLSGSSVVMTQGRGSGGDRQPALVYIAAGHCEVGLWDVAAGRCVQVVRCLSEGQQPQEWSDPGRVVPRPAALAPSPPEDRADPRDTASLLRHLSVANLAPPQPRPPGFRSLLATGEGALLTGGSEGAIRLWLPTRPCNSYLVAASPSPPSAVPLSQEGTECEERFTFKYTCHSRAGVPVIEEFSQRVASEGAGGATANGSWSRTAATRQRQLANIAHRDAVTGFAAVESSDRLLVSACQDGIIKVWK